MEFPLSRNVDYEFGPYPAHGTEVTNKDRESFAYFLSDPSCKSLFLGLS